MARTLSLVALWITGHGGIWAQKAGRPALCLGVYPPLHPTSLRVASTSPLVVPPVGALGTAQSNYTSRFWTPPGLGGGRPPGMCYGVHSSSTT